MRRLELKLWCIIAGVSMVAVTLSAAESDSGEDRFLTNIRRLTYEGRRAGEGYFSPDGRKLVFQSEREPGNPFFQIYELDLTTGDTRRVSTGVGKTTCSFIQPGTGAVLFASTHHDPESESHQKKEIELRASGEKRRYSWDYDPEMDLWVEEKGRLERLTTARGYDAEASYSPDGKWIVFSSTRHAYEQDPSDVEAELLEINPSFFGEIYRMRADGSQVERLTTAEGYDGGPFYSPDGSRIVWRRFDRDGLIADVWMMNANGSDQRQITDFSSMSWAPYLHPSGRYVFFASNKHGFGNFEVFLVDVNGTREPVRVTFTDRFDGLPVPSPDGLKLVWTSSRHQRQGSEGGQLYMADWNHEAALAALEESPLRD